MNSSETFKNTLFEDADFYQLEARECFDMAEMLEAEHSELAEAWLMDGRDYESKFHQILNKLMKELRMK